MRIFLTGTGCDLGRGLLATLEPDHQVIAFDGLGGEREPDGWHHEELRPLLAGCDAVVHAALYDPPARAGLDPVQTLLDTASRRTWHLLTAAHQEKVRRCLLLTSLEPLRHYPADVWVGEQFHSVPSTDPFELACHLVEMLAIESRRDWQYRPLVVRLGRLVRAAAVAGWPYDPCWLDVVDAVGAIEAMLLAEEPRQWGGRGTIHVCADRPDAFSRLGPLQRWAKFTPAERFGWQPPEEAA
ncbi:MAG: NAD(P)-dependent oxidoreductase [Fimbriimonadaceae bacterium]|nr:NAD(P)-dependent oxidoreductase [Fimbriimonadaceae bacterium]